MISKSPLVVFLCSCLYVLTSESGDFLCKLINCGIGRQEGTAIMKISYFEIGKILDLNKWQILQDFLAQVTKLAIITIDHKGTPVTRHSAPRDFCSHIRRDAELEKFCQTCDARAGFEAVRQDAPFIYLCHCNIVDLAIPISVQEKYIGAVMAGQVRLADSAVDLERILITPTTKIFRNDSIQQMYDAIPVLSYAEIEAVAKMLFHLCNYIVEEAINKNVVLDMYERFVPRANGSAAHVDDFSTNNVDTLKKELGNIVVNTYVKQVTDKPFLCKNSALEPAFQYMEKNKGEKITQKKMAELCHLSSSHFSRLFGKETGETFSAFLARHKVEWSKQLLEKTDISINQISDELGFSDPGYYIKVFKKHEGMTPALYRKHSQEKQA